jgi:transketolase
MRAMPNMTMLAPGDPVEVRLATRAIANWPGPCYLRLGKGGEPSVHCVPPSFAIGRAISLRGGTDVTLISTGGTLAIATQAADELAHQGVSAQVLSMHTLWPHDEEAVLEAAQQTGKIVTVEEHSAAGLSSVVSEVLARVGLECQFIPLRLDSIYTPLAGGQNMLRAQRGISVEAIVKAALQPWEGRKN